MIHSCNSREWYVRQYLLPSLLKQGIEKANICVWQDVHCRGNLQSFIDSCNSPFITENAKEHTWHLQDDVIISSTFKQETERYEDDIVCGFICKYDEGIKPGKSTVKDGMWFSFPCIKFSNKLAIQFAEWARYNLPDLNFKVLVDSKKGDDLLFKIFLEENFPNKEVYNLAPNLVDHIDYLLGGSIVNKQRGQDIIRSIYWNEPELVKELEREILKDRVVI